MEDRERGRGGGGKCGTDEFSIFTRENFLNKGK
jgi:hypothetical protein